MATTKVLGLDVALACTGWAVLSYADGDLIDCGEVKTSPKFGLLERLITIRDSVTEIITDVRGVDHDVDVAVEDGIAYQSGTTTRRLAMAWAMALTAVWESEGIEPHVMKPTEVKKLATGNGRAKKVAMVATAQSRWGDRITTDNIADAAWVAQHARLRMHSLFPEGEHRQS